MTRKFWSETVKALVPYVPGEQPQGEKVTKLNTNENPYPPSEQVKQALLEKIGSDAASLRLYPDFAASELKAELASYHGVKPEQIFLGNGSDEVLAHVFQALLVHKHPILFPDVTYSFYTVYCGLFKIEYDKVPLNEDFEIRVDDYLRPERLDNGGIVIANPNAPTGIALSKEEISRLLKENKQSMVVVDEAYVDYGGETVIPLITDFKNLLVVRTFSKSRALAGLRIGYAVGDTSLICALDRVKDSFNSYPLDTLAQAAGAASIRDEVYFQQCRQAVIKSRDKLSHDLEQLGFRVLPSSTNFVFVSTPQMKAVELAEELKKRHILVRHFKVQRIEDFLRISIGTAQECEQLVAACKEILANLSVRVSTGEINQGESK